jgi:hypothetical protein
MPALYHFPKGLIWPRHRSSYFEGNQCRKSFKSLVKLTVEQESIGPSPGKIYDPAAFEKAVEVHMARRHDLIELAAMKRLRIFLSVGGGKYFLSLEKREDTTNGWTPTPFPQTQRFCPSLET